MKLISLPLVLLPLLAACATSAPTVATLPAELPAEVRVPAGHKPVLQLKGAGDIVWICDFKGPPTDNKYEWTIMQPDAKLLDRDGKQVGRLVGKPAEFDYWAGSTVIGASVATAPAGAGNLALELLKAEPARGNHDAFKGTTFIQRVATRGGAAPSQECSWMNHRQSRNVKYEANYVFYRAG
ncbi:MAG: DUF3455 domain-containing protein [Ramlibacter sp.]